MQERRVRGDAADSQRGTCTVHRSPESGRQRGAASVRVGYRGGWDHGKAVTAVPTCGAMVATLQGRRVCGRAADTAVPADRRAPSCHGQPSSVSRQFKSCLDDSRELPLTHVLQRSRPAPFSLSNKAAEPASNADKTWAAQKIWLVEGGEEELVREKKVIKLLISQHDVGS